MAELLSKQLLVQRSIDRALDNFKKLGKANFTAAKIRSRLDTLQENWSQFQEGHLRLAQAIPEKDRVAMSYFRDNYFDATEDTYQNTRDALTDALAELDPVVSPQAAFHSTCVQSDATALALSHMPPIRLPPFDGNYSDWENFRDRFSALVINNNSLGDFSRMHYLASSLTGRALDCITNIPITADNFQVAWSTLIARFENKRRLIASHFSTLFGLSALQKESASDLQVLCDKVHIAVSSLRNLNRNPSELWNDFLVHLIVQNLDTVSRKAWSTKISDADAPPTYHDLTQFLTSRCRALEECSSSHLVKSSRIVTTSRVHLATASSPTSACPLCKARHYLSACSKFIAMNPKLRMEVVKKFKRCFNCMSNSHSLSDCKSKYSCRSCQKRHHSMLHLDSDSLPITVASESADIAPHTATNQINSLVASTTPHDCPRVMFATVRVTIRVSSGRSMVIRALLDQGSEASFVSEALAQLLRAKRYRAPASVSALGNVPIKQARQAIGITVSPSHRDTPMFATTALILPSLTSYASERVASLSDISHLSHLSWADTDPTGSDPIQLIIGAELYGEILLDGVVKGAPGQPIAQKTVFGWVISDSLASTTAAQHCTLGLTVHHCTSVSGLEDAISKFWEVEELPTSQFLTPQEEQCEDHFCATHSRDSHGRYIVRLPFLVIPPLKIGHSRHVAEKQLRSLSRRLDNQPVLRLEYCKFMREYEQLRHMRRAPEPHATCQCVYIPHHPVVNADSATTRLRVVFNASSITSSGTSLNDFLHSGPKLQTDLSAILLQWRQFRFVYIADIAKISPVPPNLDR